ncbi:expressed protein [Batrachochytrium dendrobatidis JAM81]|uniref:Expressed protein n=1 Tax=Batrachochytrium dendrobatidis (strain JAM81 / FGSC 10211) TaxID=684364 RepID=F4NXA5_BATDJ|nr:uncharacterized protein BATDEDRAFT_31308 [Batrachochytrium dendrobatidis JAM81]EGF82641.1 expressed protein [Batrachochytrium dendrobatidis JAM81]|eukprot:XP_006676740.1 expressed protein [Batrachochytrium dendrobatidis JAM81]
MIRKRTGKPPPSRNCLTQLMGCVRMATSKDWSSLASSLEDNPLCKSVTYAPGSYKSRPGVSMGFDFSSRCIRSPHFLADGMPRICSAF